MKKDIHPQSHLTVFKFTNGKEIKMNSTLGRKDKEVVQNVGDWPLDSHPAWTKSHTGTVKSTTNVKKFQAKFASSLFSAASEETKEEEGE